MQREVMYRVQVLFVEIDCAVLLEKNCGPLWKIFVYDAIEFCAPMVIAGVAFIRGRAIRMPGQSIITPACGLGDDREFNFFRNVLVSSNILFRCQRSSIGAVHRESCCEMIAKGLVLA